MEEYYYEFEGSLESLFIFLDKIEEIDFEDELIEILALLITKVQEYN